VQKLDLVLTHQEPLPADLKDRLRRVDELAKSLPTELVSSGTWSALKIPCSIISHIGGLILSLPEEDRHNQFQPALAQLKWYAEDARLLCTQIVSKHFGFERHAAYEPAVDRGRGLLQEDTNSDPLKSAPSTSSAQVSAIESGGLFPCIFGMAGTKVKEFRKCNVVSGTEFDWKRHDNQHHRQQALWICPELTCRLSFFRQSTYLEDHLRKDHRRIGDLADEVGQWHIKENHQESFFCPHCDKVLRHGLTDSEAIEERFRHMLTQHIRPQDLPDDIVWVEKEGSKTHQGMEIETVPHI
jgi:hypothetical protein